MLGKDFFSGARLVRSRCPAPSHTQTQTTSPYYLQASCLSSPHPTGAAATGVIYIHTAPPYVHSSHMLDHMVPYLRPIDNRFPIERIEMTNTSDRVRTCDHNMIALKT